ncbi:chemotaxis response regulator protein-glutamate methylesterase [Thalassovita sp.]|uniref:protein-glutamate methylesterase/protein-glutamine glutaminase n=1 Tax=Thalassovita sp. TaxID=1979401 RepID=UPI002B26DA66|nr:chemotaxis response regulator protein-glutamate methylesterase [Thalassovita sp.]
MNAHVTTHDQVRVMIVEDSLTARTMLKQMVETAPDLKVVDMARDPFDAAEKMRKALPDVILLDVEMPRMDGLTFLRRIMAQHPIPVVICSNHTQQGSAASMKALEMGAVEVLSKADVGALSKDDEGTQRVCHAVRAASQARISPKSKAKPKRTVRDFNPQKKQSPDVIMPRRNPTAPAVVKTPPIIGIGASTGGTEALARVLKELPVDCPPIAIVQHMPEKFTEAFANRLNKLCDITVREARDGDKMERGLALVAPGSHHITIERNGRAYICRVIDGPPVSRHKPSVDVLFRSLSISAGANAQGVIMTGMGDDGAQCLLEMREAGASTLAQNEESCVVYGMPREAVERGAAESAVHLSKIASQIMSFDAEHRARVALKG